MSKQGGKKHWETLRSQSHLTTVALVARQACFQRVKESRSPARCTRPVAPLGRTSRQSRRSRDPPATASRIPQGSRSGGLHRPEKEDEPFPSGNTILSPLYVVLRVLDKATVFVPLDGCQNSSTVPRAEECRATRQWIFPRLLTKETRLLP